MKTILQGTTSQVTIDNEGPFTIIGEKINPTGSKKIANALLECDYDTLIMVAEQQLQAGAQVLDVNVGLPELNDVMVLPEVIKILSQAIDVPICIDTPNPEALAAALKVAPGKPLVNSVNGEAACLEAILPLVKAHQAAVIALTMDEGGIPADAETRLSIAEKILDRVTQIGIPTEDVIFDPLVLAIGTDDNAGMVVLETIKTIKKRFDANINLGASNISFGLPDRHVINQAFLSLAIGAGASCAITDPMKLTPSILAADLLLGRDPYSSRYIANFRARQSPPS